ncbi:MAG TPA: ABC transporter substrate-binding protein [Mycobacteriales bacterium]|jgi:hypothetical protein|nr:ABC transporter substrate-binding protein [Mycobacteriales bacterium]
MRSSRVVAAVMLVGLLGTACGARLSAGERKQAAAAVLNAGTGGSGAITGGSGSTGVTGGGTGTVTGGGGGGGGAVTGGGGAAAGGGSTTTGGGGTGGGSIKSSGNTQNSTGGTKTTSCPTSGTDVGLTKSTINLGTIADLTGPVPGLFTGAVQGIEAFANYINHTGGLCGHAIHVDAADGGTNCSQNQNDTQNLISKDFALVGTFSLYDGCGATILKQHPTVPDIHVSLDPAAGTLSNHFDLEPGGLGYATGPFAYYKQKYGASAVQHVGTIIENIPSAVAKQKAIEHAAESQGWRFTYSRTAGPTETSFTNDFTKMCNSGVRIFFEVTENAQNAATMLQNEHANSRCNNLINIIPIAYDQALLGFYQGNKNDLKVQGYNEYSMFFNTQDAAQIPELKLLQTWFRRTNPGKPLNLYAMYAWADGRLFQQAFENAGKVANRRTVLAALHKIKNFNAGGVVAPAEPGSKSVGVHCYVVWQLANSQFTRVAPSSGYRCDGRFLRD